MCKEALKANWRKQMAPLSEARHRSHRSRDASGQADPSLEPSEHYRRGLTVSTGGQQRGQMCIFQCNDYPFFWCHVFVFVHGLVLLRPAWRLNGSNKAGLGSSHCRWRRNWRYHFKFDFTRLKIYLRTRIFSCPVSRQSLSATFDLETIIHIP